MNRVLLVDDDERMAPPLTEYFSRFSIELESTPSPLDALKRLQDERFDLAILDIMLPEMDGFELCREIRKQSEIPILMLTARGDVTDRIVGLELGADDYLSKPFEPRELVARIQRILKRSQQPPPNSNRLEFERLALDQKRQQLWVDGEEITLTHMEFQLLLLLAQSPGAHFTRDQILNHLKGIDAQLFSRAIDNMVSRIRQKLKPFQPIKTVWGSGYTFVAAPK